MALDQEQLEEIKTLVSTTSSTKRATVSALEEILYQPIPILDHGFVRVIDYMGDDSAIVQAARVSYGKGTKQVTQDKALIAYLMRHSHTTPFEMCELKLHIKLPIFVARQWIRHRTANINEYSGRYSILDKEFYIPSEDQIAAQSAQNNQGRGNTLTLEESRRVLDILKEDAERAYSNYMELLNEDEKGNVLEEERQGLARELARMNLSLNFYTQWYWKCDLHNLFHFLALRADSHAQYEIRVYGEAMLDILKRWVPFAYESFMEYRFHGTRISAKGLQVIKSLIKGNPVAFEESGMGKREWGELQALLGLLDDV